VSFNNLDGSASAVLGTRLNPDQRYNFLSCLVDASGWGLGIAFFSTSTIVPAFLSRLGAGNIVIGLLPAFITAAYNMPGALIANHIARLPRARPFLFTVALIERVPLLLMGIAALTLHGPTLLLWTFLVLYALHSVALGINQPAYWIFIAKTIPAPWRGRLFGFAGLVGGTLGFAVLPITDHFLNGPASTLIRGFGWCFVIGSLIEFVSCMPLAFVREPMSIQPAAPGVDILNKGRFGNIWRSSQPFRRFIWGQFFFSIWMISTPFYLLDGIRRLHVTDAQCGLYTSLGVVITAFGGSLWGVVSDRRGNRLILIASALSGLVASVYALIAPSPALLSVVFGFSALAVAGVGLSGYNITMEFAPTERDVPHYTAFYNAAVSPVRAIAFVSGGLIAERFGYAPVFILSAVAAAISIALTLRLVEPRHSNVGGRMEDARL
jgi:MFS family permease